MSQETSHFSSLNRGTRVNVEGRGGYRSLTSHYYSHNSGDRGGFLTSPVSYLSVEGKFHEEEKVGGDIEFVMMAT